MKRGFAAAAFGLLWLLVAACAAGAVKEHGLPAFPPPGGVGERWVVTNVIYEMEGTRVAAMTLRIERVPVRHVEGQKDDALALKR